MRATYLKQTTDPDGKPKAAPATVEIAREHVAAALRAGLEAALAAGRAGREGPQMANAATDAIVLMPPAGLPPAVMVQPANALHRWIRRETDREGVKEFLSELDIERAITARLDGIDQGEGLDEKPPVPRDVQMELDAAKPGTPIGVFSNGMVVAGDADRFEAKFRADPVAAIAEVVEAARGLNEAGVYPVDAFLKPGR